MAFDAVPIPAYIKVRAKGHGVIRAILSILGGIFTFVTLGIIGFVIGIGGVFWIYGRDLPSYASLAQYQPPIISRIYSSEGQLIDEFARERRLFTAAEDIPDLIKQASFQLRTKISIPIPDMICAGFYRALWMPCAVGENGCAGRQQSRSR